MTQSNKKINSNSDSENVSAIDSNNTSNDHASESSDNTFTSSRSKAKKTGKSKRKISRKTAINKSNNKTEKNTGKNINTVIARKHYPTRSSAARQAPSRLIDETSKLAVKKKKSMFVILFKSFH